ncbi:hypothetical protein LOD68_11160 [Xylella fastidiosa subsp. multiplex]|uniref:hypothetical protein n=1 Tax=Xylella fastidiosa TaxID=2371 RepID=UPI00234DB5AB|nr:hypothetical protein [Xylella fastidiosa]MDC6413595.1 hypothetical protein [Xylella fastidiosa subsp. multiplex]MDD0866614.1 hypothetical protein [Xylella fastidiosa subsp. multiplex]MDD0875630.1 hypothetical protein [Xylella fastidiosa subsp. multiplex]MDD0877774.1 hypothetical protein [Xylella fastidiosa subsp. multiplex]MDD0879829.1 hypothetical protein [Xylella fastidiosa subsp. multiplex]
MLRVATRYPAEGMSFKSLGDQSEVSSASKVFVTDQEGASDASSDIRFLVAGIKKILGDLIIAQRNFDTLRFRECDIGVFHRLCILCACGNLEYLLENISEYR